MRTDWRSWGAITGLSMLAMVRLWGCEAPPPEATDSEVLAGVYPQVIQPALQDFRADVELLQRAVHGWTGVPDDSVRAAWRRAMGSWQRVELMQIGPLASTLSAADGLDLRDEIYSWPAAVNPCRIDHLTVDAGWSTEGFFEESTVDGYGLDALEQLIFAGPHNSCPSDDALNQDGIWDALSVTELQERRADYARTLTAHLLVDLDRAEANFNAQSVTASAVFDALFYLDLSTSDRKLGEVLGEGDCTTDCAQLAESLLSGGSTEWIAENLVGFRRLFVGGLDPLVRDAGYPELADDLLAEVDAAEAQARSIGEPLHLAHLAEVEELHDEVEEVTDLLKSVAAVLTLTLPSEADGDAD